MEQEEYNRLCEICSQACKQKKGMVIVQCVHFKDPRKDSGTFLNQGKIRRPGLITTKADKGGK